MSDEQLQEIGDSGIVASTFEYVANPLQYNADEPFPAQILRIDTQSQLIYVQPSYCTYEMKKLNAKLE